MKLRPGFRRTAVATGHNAELLAERFLEQSGCRVVDRNYRIRSGEIDLIALHDDDLVFVEVRFRRRTDFGHAAETVDRRKQMRIIRAAEHYLMAHPEHAHRMVRFDIIGVGVDRQAPQLDWLQDAFDADA